MTVKQRSHTPDITFKSKDVEDSTYIRDSSLTRKPILPNMVAQD